MTNRTKWILVAAVAIPTCTAIVLLAMSPGASLLDRALYTVGKAPDLQDVEAYRRRQRELGNEVARILRPDSLGAEDTDIAGVDQDLLELAQQLVAFARKDVDQMEWALRRDAFVDAYWRAESARSRLHPIRGLLDGVLKDAPRLGQ